MFMMIKSFYKVTFFILALELIHSRFVLAFEIEGNKWIGAEAVIYFSLDGKSDSGIFWKEALLQAVNDWNKNTSFTFKPINQYLDPCLLLQFPRLTNFQDFSALRKLHRESRDLSSD